MNTGMIGTISCRLHVVLTALLHMRVQELAPTIEARWLGLAELSKTRIRKAVTQKRGNVACTEEDGRY